MTDMSDLVKGDKLICIDSVGSPFMIGGTYTFNRYDGDNFVYVKGELNSYSINRFRKAIPVLIQHRHRDVIIAWANGEIVQHCGTDIWTTWDFGPNFTPQWHIGKWRVKPKVSEFDLQIQKIQDKMDALNKELETLKGE